MSRRLAPELPKLTLFTDYAMRTPLYLGARPERPCSIGEVAQAYRISQNHLMKVVVELVRSAATSRA
jgi:Rrf2 family nitric oxide-sensitive transcriptional repressor